MHFDAAFVADIRINTIKHAMIGQLQNPSQGFEDVIKAHFYLKKDRILQVRNVCTVYFNPSPRCSELL